MRFWGIEMNYEFHEYADIFPLIAESELQSLANDIRANGLLHPVVILDGKILDGRNRYLACTKAGVDPYFVEFSGTDPLSFIISENLNRRHLNESQRAIVAARLANMTRSDAGAIGNVAQGNATANLRLRDKVSTETAASMLNVGKRSVELAKEVMRKAPEKIKDIEGGKKSLNSARREIKHKEVENAAPKNKKAPTGQPAEPDIIDQAEEVANEMFDTIVRRFSKLNNKQKIKAITILVRSLEKLKEK